MAHYERTITVQAEANHAFEWVSKIENLPHYLPTLKAAQPEPGERIRVEGDVAGHHYDTEGYFRADKAARRMEWGSTGQRRYSGWLTVHPGDTSSLISEVTVHLDMDPPAAMPPSQAEGQSVDERILLGMEKALISIQNHVERPVTM